MFSNALSVSARLGPDTEVQAEGCRAAALCSQHADRHSLHRGSLNRWGVVMRKVGGWRGWGGFTHWMPRPMGQRGDGGGGGGTCCPATHLPASALHSLYSQFLFSVTVSRSLSRGCRQVVGPSATTSLPLFSSRRMFHTVHHDEKVRREGGAEKRL